ncbi:MAG: MBL fold metallo-hydrolase [Clostridia bacterium]|nr:MBL fold metallo-hydrolase [Clostridia bacterium]
MKVKFCGAARSVTGSCHLVECEHGRFLVDCGMRQGDDKRNEYGEDGFPFDPKSIDAVLLTHAHIDHSGLIPLLVKQGFSGHILATKATERLCTIMLPDSAGIQESDAETANRKRMRAGKPALEPLYTLSHANTALTMFRSVDYGKTVKLLKGVNVCFQDSGHLLGSACIEIWVDEGGKTTKLLFSGDIGRKGRPIIRDPYFADSADYIIMEGTYGDTNHGLFSEDAKREQFAEALRAAIRRGGNIVIPSFAVGRTQELLYYLKQFLQDPLVPVPGLENVPVYIDSPLGIEATRIYERSAAGYFDDEAMELAANGSPFDFPTLRVARSTDESKLINSTPGQKIIISSSGMCEAGRIRHHLKHNLYDNRATVLFPGYQAVGTLGRILIDGAERVKMFGENISVRASIERLTEFSGHAGKNELIEWVTSVKGKPSRVFLVHGEDAALNSLEKSLSALGYNVTIPSLGSEFVLDGHSAYATESAGETAISINAIDRDAGIVDQLNRIYDLLDSIRERRSPDIALKLELMEDDIRSFADRWSNALTR